LAWAKITLESERLFIIKKRINNNNEKQKEKQAEKIEKSFRCKRIFFYILTILIDLFSFYYITCFCTIYENTQKYLFLDFLIDIPINLSNCLIYCFIHLIIKMLIIKGEFSIIKNMILIILGNEFFNFLLEIRIELLLIPIIDLIVLIYRI
jgi:hypothetical protein